MIWLVLIGLFVYCLVFTILGIKFCVALANMLGVDPRNVPDKTYSVNGVYFGTVLGFLVMLLSGSVIVGFIAAIVIGLIFFVIIFFIEIGINKATRPLSDKIEEKLTDVFDKNKSGNNYKSDEELTPLERAARADEAKEKAANERKLLEAGGWRCAKCGKVNVASIGFCTCGTSRGESKRITEESKKKLEEIQKNSDEAAKDSSNENKDVAKAQVTTNQISPATYTAPATSNQGNKSSQSGFNIEEYDLRILDEEIEGSKWKCVECGTVNPKLVGTCKCGNTLQKNDEIIAGLKKYREDKLMAAKEEASKKEAEFDIEISGIMEKSGIENPSTEQKTVLRMLKRSNERLSVAEISHKLPRTANIKAFKQAIEELTNAGVLEIDENQKYGIKEA